jgi:cysteine desulfuration protein SufE
MSSPFDEIIAEFAELEPRERLEMLLDYTENFPPLPEELERQRQAGEHRIHECQTPVFLWVEVVGEEPANRKVQMHAWVAPEAPTVKGFVGILLQAFNGASPDVVLNVPQDLLKQLGLIESLGMVRARGLSAILYYVRSQVQKQL